MNKVQVLEKCKYYELYTQVESPEFKDQQTENREIFVVQNKLTLQQYVAKRILLITRKDGNKDYAICGEQEYEKIQNFILNHPDYFVVDKVIFREKQDDKLE